jgi:CTP synthase (UTP-ammonia lyase)
MPSGAVRIAMIGDENVAYPSHRELNAVRGHLGVNVRATWVATDGAQVRDLDGFDGVWLVPGSPYADDRAVYDAITWARERDVPFLGTCSGLQYSVVELFRNVLGVPEASHAESDGASDTNVVTALTCTLQGERREIRPVAGTRFAGLVGEQAFSGMHYCSYAPDPAKLDRLSAAGVTVGAVADDAGAEVLELNTNRFFIVSLFQPQVGALAGQPLHPLLVEFVRCARAYAVSRPAQAGARS